MLTQPELWIQIAAGAALLLFGKRLFWLCLGVVGFLLTVTVLSRMSLGIDDRWMLLVSLLLGVVGAVIAIAVQKIALAVAGFLFGAFTTLYILDSYGPEVGNLAWILALVGGIVACFLAVKLFNVALAVLSSILGSGLIVSATNLDPMPAAILLLCLAAFGISTQLRRRKRHVKKAALGT